jgi:hypothetical protein
MGRHSVRSAAAVALACLMAVPQAPAAEPPPFSEAELDQMVAPIALFPDALLSQMLMAATYPADLELAVEWAYANRQLEGDAAVVAAQDQPWDPSVQSLLAFPQALAMLGENPRWARDLGDAFLGQPEEVMDTVQRLRGKAQAAGNLSTNEHHVIGTEAAAPDAAPAQIVTIVPARAQVVFVPVVHPAWVFGPWWRPAFPPFFFPPSVRWGWGWTWGTSVRVGFWWGPPVRVTHSMWGGVSWHRRSVHINVNHWNSIHVNRRIDSRSRQVGWQHDPRSRRGVPYRNTATRNRFQPGGARPLGADPRQMQRDRARATLESRVGAQNLDPGALRDVDRGRVPARPPVDRSQLQSRAASAAVVNRDHALRGAGNAAQTRRQIERGSESLAAMRQRVPAGRGQ